MAISKIVAKSVDFQAADGEMDNDYALRIANAEATDGRSYGLRIDAGSTSDEAFIVKDHDSSNTLIKIDGYGHITKPKQPAFLAVPASTVTNFQKMVIILLLLVQRYSTKMEILLHQILLLL